MSSLTGLNGYDKLFSSIGLSSRTAPLSRLLYGGTVTSLYSKKLSNLANSVSNYINNSTINNSTAVNLKTASEKLSGKNGIFNSKTAVSDNKALSATVASGASKGTYKISVSQLATAQTNKSSVFTSNAKSSFAEGLHSFKITSGGKDSYFSFTVKDGQTNKKSLDDMAAAINGSKSGVTAKVVSDETKNTSYLEITSDNTGTKNVFSVTALSGDAVEKSQINNISEKAQDAKFKVNDEDFTSQTNSVSLDNGRVNVTFNSVIEKDATITVKEDAKAIADTIKNFVSNLNDVLSSTDDTSAGITKITKELQSAISSKRTALYEIGITVNSDETLSVDTDRLEKAINTQPQKVKFLFEGYDGLANKAEKTANKLIANDYISGIQGNSGNDYSSFYNYMKASGKNYYMQNYSRGLILDTIL